MSQVRAAPGGGGSDSEQDDANLSQGLLSRRLAHAVRGGLQHARQGFLHQHRRQAGTQVIRRLQSLCQDFR